MRGLEALRVVEVGSGIAAPYCAKLFADARAEVIKVEPPEGDPLRSWSATGGDLGGRDGAFFRFLNAGKSSVVGRPGDASVDALFAGADLVVEDLGPRGDLDRAAVLAAHPGLVLVSLSPYGLTGPYADRPATEFTIQAESGSLAIRGVPGEEPFQAGGRTTEFVAGVFAAVGALAAVRRARETGRGEHLDCSLHEGMALASTLFIDLMWSLMDAPPAAGPPQSVETPSIEPTADGWVGFNTNTAQQISDFLLMIERPDLRETGEFSMAGQRMGRMQEWEEIVHAWTRRHATDEIIEQARLLRIPVAPIGNGRTVLEHEQLVARRFFREDPSGGFQTPEPPYRIDGERPPTPRPAPVLGSDAARPREASRPEAPAESSRPLDGLLVVDATTWWAGPSATHALACLGADVVHVESTTKIDGARAVGGMFTGKWDSWWEASPFFLSANANKRGLALDLAKPEGLAAMKDLIARADVFVENFSPRVMEGFGLTWETVRALNPRCVMVRMPAFGLDGPWRESVGFAQTMEQLSGLAWLTGHPDDRPRIQRGPCDPLAGMHAAFATLVALAERDASGRGHFVECAMVEGALNVAAEQVIEWTAYGNLLARQGNRSPEAAPQGLYPCAGHDAAATPRWLALSIATDEQWRALLGWLGDPDWAGSLRDASLAGRHAAADEIDARLRETLAARELEASVDGLVAAGVPAAALADPRALHQHPQLRARGFFETLEHPVVGAQRTATLPYHLASLKRWLHAPAPTLGEHNRELLAELGRSPGEIDSLEAAGVIGDWPAGVATRD